MSERSTERVPLRQHLHKPVSPPVSGTATVTIACKYPLGLILYIHEKSEVTEQGYAGSRTMTLWRRKLDHPVYINGPARPLDLDQKRNPPPEFPIVGGYALTTGVSKDFWECWLEQNKDTDLVKNHMIFAKTNEDDAKAKSRDGNSIRTGLEGIDPDNPTSVSKELQHRNFKLQKGEIK